MLAIISGSVAFLAPEIGIVPFSGLPPTMRMRSMKVPVGGLTWPVYPLSLSAANPAESWGSRRFLAFRPAARLRLAALEVFPQRRLQALLAPLFFRFRPVLHAG